MNGDDDDDDDDECVCVSSFLVCGLSTDIMIAIYFLFELRKYIGNMEIKYTHVKM